MDEKLFFEVFNGLKIDNKNLAVDFENVKIKRIAINRNHTAMRVYIKSSRLIEKSAIYDMEKILKNFLREDEDRELEVYIIEEYTLSSQYNSKNLYDIYKESFLLEFKHEGLIAARMFKNAKVDFADEEHLTLTFEEGVVSKEKGNYIKETIHNIYLNRFGMPIEINLEFIEPETGKYEKENELKLKIETENLLKKVAEFDKTYDNNQAKSSEENQSESKSAEKETKKFEKTGGFTKKSFGKKAGFAPLTSFVQSDNPDVLYGRDFEYDDEVQIKDIFADIGHVVIRGQIIGIDVRPIRGERSIVTLTVTDFTDTINCKLFIKDEFMPDFKSNIKEKSFVRVKGTVMYDTYEREINIQNVAGIRKSVDFRHFRQDTSVEKRVELHCHTKMSDMDGVSDVKDIVKRAYKWGHPAIAITDHGVVQAFPDAWHTYEDLKKDAKKEGKDFNFKVIYGVEAYLVDDLNDVILNPKGQTLEDKYVVFDIETTGFSPVKDRIIEIGAVKVENGKIKDRFSTFINPQVPIPSRIEKLTGISDEMVIDAPTVEEVLPEFFEWCEDSVMVAHDANFDMSFIHCKSELLGLDKEYTVVDTVAMSQFLLFGLAKYNLEAVSKALKIKLENHHRAVDDAECTAKIFLELCKQLREKELYSLDEINKEAKKSNNIAKKAHAYHAIILVKNDLGRVNLYKLISKSHLETFYRRPRILKSDYLALKEGLMIGSACEAGELYQAVLHGQSDADIARLCEFYDYYEIQPLGNNEFMLPTGDRETDEKNAKRGVLVDSIKDLIDINKKIVALGRKFDKMVVATCDVHFLDPEDEMYRRIIQAGNGFKDADNQAPLYLRTTQEMLDEFYYLDSDVAKEIVIDNPNRINMMIEDISPIHPDKCPPVIENSDVELRKMCYDTAHSMYGNPLPEYVENRLEKELKSIIGNGYAVMYIMAQRLVKHSNDDGYLVGSRGSVGSSFVATMSGITEVNPLKPHYYCPHCHYTDFEPKEVEELGISVGLDLPDKQCPNCGEKLKKDGFEIPFETFLGFYGDKEPDIDLNFSGENQPEAHRYTEVMFGKGHTFRAGTITGVAEKTAFGYVKNYYDDHNVVKRRCEIERVASGCEGIRRSTGQHPGGIVIVPRDKEIYEFTPIQRPANDMEADTITTHFEYHAIDANLLKLDILGHDDPTMIRNLEKYTGTNAKEIPFDDKEVLSLFENTDALGVKPEDIGGVKLGTLGLPELGTNFVLQMLEDAKPRCVADLVRISGLSHGTDVWTGNAQELINSGTATISTAICTRDDIMTYLISKGIEPGVSFKIMENVRKGNVAKGKCAQWEEWVENMRANDVPDWYIDSCKKIKYMFPKAHAAAYIMMALRIAWYKVHYPLAYYAVYFGTRSKAFNYEVMCQGPEKLNSYIKDYETRKAKFETSPKDDDMMKDMAIVREMYARGFRFLPLDIYTAKAHNFMVVDGKLMPSIDSIEGMGGTAADGVVNAVAELAGEKFISKDDFRQRSKVTKTVVETMSELGLLNGLPESNQLSFFDML